MSPPLPPHLHAALVDRLRQPDLAGLDADAAFDRLAGVSPCAECSGSGRVTVRVAERPPDPDNEDTFEQPGVPAHDAERVCQHCHGSGQIQTDKNFLGLRKLVFVPRAKWERLPAKRREWLEQSHGVVVTDADVPGFPNKLRREWFDAAWEEAGRG